MVRLSFVHTPNSDSLNDPELPEDYAMYPSEKPASPCHKKSQLKGFPLAIYSGEDFSWLVL